MHPQFLMNVLFNTINYKLKSFTFINQIRLKSFNFFVDFFRNYLLYAPFNFKISFYFYLGLVTLFSLCQCILLFLGEFLAV